ncbi:tetraacyldisaccharide 4'-kinase [Agaricicola taiwanensis]|uniref:Tetraacyldisaccharide 4'-kinase n=1 Tax=Agaricicola taiwanensis TaxID=591372 RepID=A0A8J2VP15_9RHOB|nr:tetraacyldisaccharide 4'-kinase [Agaricicola taiwanensis]GGE34362.1 tetraacyldisaccharide 4'-kinase [Agaricicola taiwanensis]
MRAPAFWWRERPGLAAFLLSPVGAVWGALTSARMARSGTGVGVPVICVGNPVAGGAGKTPTAMALAVLMTGMKVRPAIVSRGYGGSLQGPVRVDPYAHGAEAIGDEPLLLARQAATYVAHDRVAGARMAVADGATAVVLDDGFQNPALTKDLSLLVVDGAVGVGNGLCLPAGPLRAPMDDQLRRSDGLIIIGTGAAGDVIAATARAAGKPVFLARLAPDREIAARLNGRRVIGFAGIGRPAKFAATLREVGAEIAAFHALGDHAVPSPSKARAILSQAEQEGALVVATEKDVVKLSTQGELGALKAATIALPVTLQFEDEARIRDLLGRAIVSVGSDPVQ